MSTHKRSDQVFDYIENEMSHRDNLLGVAVLILGIIALFTWSSTFAALALGGAVGLVVRLWLQRPRKEKR